MNKNNEDLKRLLDFMVELNSVLTRHGYELVPTPCNSCDIVDSDGVDQWSIDTGDTIADDIKTIKEMLDDEKE